MGNSDSVIPSQVRELIKESQKIDGWVTRLADHASDAREEVVDKVRQDYLVRLQAVNGQLAEHRVSLAETLEARRSEVESLRADRDEHAAELEEAKLRHAVGEYGDSEWKKRRVDVEQTLEDLDGLLGLEEESVSQLTDIIGRIGSNGPQLVVDPPAVGDDPVSAEAGEAEPASEDEDESVEAAVDSVAEPATLDDAVETLEDVEDPDDAAVAEAVGASGSDPEASVETETDVADDGGEYLDELEFLESLSLGDSDRFDAVSAMLDEDEGGKASD